MAFQVVYSQANRTKLEELQVVVKQQGKQDRFSSALLAIDRPLHDSPMDFGEPLYSLPHAELQVRHGIITPLAVYYAVHQKASIVFLQDFRLLPY